LDYELHQLVETLTGRETPSVIDEAQVGCAPPDLTPPGGEDTSLHVIIPWQKVQDPAEKVIREVVEAILVARHNLLRHSVEQVGDPARAERRIQQKHQIGGEIRLH